MRCISNGCPILRRGERQCGGDGAICQARYRLLLSSPVSVGDLSDRQDNLAEPIFVYKPLLR